MIILKTRLGTYILSNCVRIDFYTTKENDSYLLHMCIDAHSQILRGFESEKDANRFTYHLSKAINKILHANTHGLFDIDAICNNVESEVIYKTEDLIDEDY